MRRAQAEDWIADLAEYSAGAVREGCARWRRSETRRPTIAELRPIIAEEQGRLDARRALPAAPLGNFPCFADRDFLRGKLKANKGGFQGFSDEERRRWYGYCCAWDRVMKLGNPPDSALGQDRTWYDAGLADAAERFFARFGVRTRERIA